MASATCSAMCRASVLMSMISALTGAGWPSSCCSSWVLLITSASSLSASATCCFSAGLSTVLASARFVNAIDSVASRIAPAKARPNESPNDPAAELTPAASLTRSSEIGASV